jgi:threonine/homoserine/homoserine lactone efflux protein
MGQGVLAVLQALLVVTVSLLVLFVGFCLIFNLPKLRRSGRQSRVVRGLDELLGVPEVYLASGAPRGPVDQLHTPELLETEGRKSA